MILLSFFGGMTSCRSHKSVIISGESRKGYEKKDLDIDLSHLSDKRRMIVEEALSWLGTPYEYAGMSKGSGTDCSGLVMKVYGDVLDAALPRNSARQAEFCDRIELDDVEAGDLVFFATGRDLSKVSHVGIMVDKVNFVHASTSKGVVISSVTTDYYSRRLIMYGRVPVKFFSERSTRQESQRL